MAEYLSDGIMEERIKNLEIKVEDVSKRVDSVEKHNSDEHSIFYDRLRDLGLSAQKNELENENIMEKLEDVSEDVKATRKDLEELKGKPSKLMGKFGTSIVSAIGSAIGGGIIVMIAYTIANGLT